MDKIYLQGNYIIVEQSGETFVYSKNFCTYYETATTILIQQNLSSPVLRTCAIPIVDIPNYYDQTGVTPYTTTTLKDFLRSNTGFKSASGGSGAAWGTITGTLTSQTDLNTALSGKQDTLTSGTNIKTINSTSLLGSGNVSVQSTLVSGTNIKTINGNSLLGSGNISAGNTLSLTTGINVTGTTAMTKSASILIAANSITQNTVLELISRAIRISGTASTIFHQIYINTTDSLTGATLLGVFNSLTATNYFSQGTRQIFIDTLTNQLTVVNAGATIATDYVNTGANTVLTFNPVNNYYIIFAVQPFNTGDTTKIQFGLIKKYE